jgi:hypothetical protein
MDFLRKLFTQKQSSEQLAIPEAAPKPSSYPDPSADKIAVISISTNIDEIKSLEEEPGEMFFVCPQCGHCGRLNDVGKILWKSNPTSFTNHVCSECHHQFDAGPQLRFGNCPATDAERASIPVQSSSRTSDTWQASTGESVQFNRMQHVTGHTYEWWTSPSNQAAKEFLNSRTVTQGDYYIQIETPKNNWGKDILGPYTY